MLLKPFTLFYIFKCNKYTVNISLKTSIGFGFYLGHPFAVAISRYAKLGNNVNISQGVTIGQKQSQSEILAPTIGNNVYVGPGSLLIGKITIADHVVIAGNSVVTKDIPECAVVAGEAAQIMSYKGSNSLLYYLWDQKEHQ